MNRVKWAIGVLMGWLWAASASAATVEFTGVYTRNLGGGGKWAIYAAVTNPLSSNPTPGRENVTGFSSVMVDVAVLGGNGQSIDSSVNMLPFGTSTRSDVSLPSVGYGFWLFRSNGTLNGTGVTGIRAAQYTPYATPGLDELVLNGAGRWAGSQAAGGVFTSATSWDAPLLVARGTFVGPEFQASSGLRILPVNAYVNLLKDMDSGPAEAYRGPGNVEAPTAVTVVAADGTGANDVMKFGTFGDANFDGVTDITDLQRMEAAYQQSQRTWFDGDFDLDGIVGTADLLLAAQNYSGPAPLPGTFAPDFDAAVVTAFAQVPEPSALALFAAALLLLPVRRVRR